MAEYTIKKYALSIVAEKDFRGITITNKKNVSDFCKKQFENIPLEHFIIIALDNGNRIIGYQVVQGATNQCAIYPANIFRFALLSCASSIIIAHNHPGGSKNPSNQDWDATNRLKKIGNELDIPLIDHVILADETIISLKNLPQWDY